MSNFSAEYKKSLVRNTRQVVPKTKVNLCNPSKDPKPIERKPAAPQRKQIDLSEPSANSSKVAIKKITEVQNKRVEKRSGVAHHEMITKQVNFHHEQQIYKDLIPLCARPHVQVAVARNPLPQKDVEPDLQAFFKRKVLPEFKYNVSVRGMGSKPVTEHDAFKMYRMMMKWE